MIRNQDQGWSRVLSGIQVTWVMNTPIPHIEISRQLVAPPSRTSIEPIQEVPPSALWGQPTADHRRPWLEELVASWHSLRLSPIRRA